MAAPVPVSSARRVAVVTGTTSGIGRVVAESLAARGFTTIVIGRGSDRIARVAEEVRASTRNPNVEGLAVSDLALISEARRLASGLATRFPQIHLLVNNAGAYYSRREVTSEGIERTFGLNVLAPFVLTTLLAGPLRSGAPSRVVNVASAAHNGHDVPWTDLQSSQHYRGFTAYGASKLELILLTREFARRLRGTGVTVNAVHPGFVASGFGLNNRGGTAVAIRVLGFLFGRRPKRGADTPVYVATAPELASVSGEYFSDRTQRPGSPQSRDMGAARRFYEECSRLTALPPLPEPPSAGS